MAKIWFGIVITILPVHVLTHFILWPPCKDNEETILEPGFLIYSEKIFENHRYENSIEVNLFVRDCRFRSPKPKSAPNYAIKGTYMVIGSFSMEHVEQFVNNCSAFEEISFYDFDEPINSLLWYGTIPESPNDCGYRARKTYFLDGISEIKLSGSKIHLMDDPEMFATLKNLKTLNLSWNLIDSMHENVFKTLTLIKNLTLSHNKITIFPETLFHNLTTLMEVDLSHNFLKYMPEDAFSGTALTTLNLSYNKLKFLPINFFRGLKTSQSGLQLFYLDCNPWHCECLKDILVELKQQNVRYHSDRLNGLNSICFLKKTTNFKCKRSIFLNKEEESNKCYF